MEYIVERITKEFVILEQKDRSHIHMPRGKFPDTLKEGDIVFKSGEMYTIDIDATNKRRQEMAEKTRKLFHKKP